MLLGIFLVPCQQLLGLNPLGLGELINVDRFTRNAIHECGEASHGVSPQGFPSKKIKIKHGNMKEKRGN